jgi:hypothetical protein
MKTRYFLPQGIGTKISVDSPGLITSWTAAHAVAQTSRSPA